MKIILCLVALAFTGCTTVEYTDTIGRKFKYSSPAFGAKQIKKVDLLNGILEGYSTEQSSMGEVMGAVYAAGLAAGAKAGKP